MEGANVEEKGDRATHYDSTPDVPVEHKSALESSRRVKVLNATSASNTTSEFLKDHEL